ncbi:MAG TPA: fluoride efflux transporter CrcB [Candidatus Thermoplasmatota archaeon]
MDWKLVVFVAGGGAVGSVARFLLAASITKGTHHIVGTLAVNVVGCFLIGLLLFGPLSAHVGPSGRAFLAVGILGGFTTMSSFSYETVALFEAQKVNLAITNIAATFVACLAGTWLGRFVGLSIA